MSPDRRIQEPVDTAPLQVAQHNTPNVGIGRPAGPVSN